MLKDFIVKKMLASKLKGIPQTEQEKIFALIEKNPDFFKNIAEKVQQKVKSGKDQMSATMEVLRENESDLKNMLGEKR
jgi:2-oxo-4-hydroxy-4-carboxy--5-ureidoimidazoline (OHCU) decarboxylase